MICGQNDSEFAQIARSLNVCRAMVSFFARFAPSRCPLQPGQRTASLQRSISLLINPTTRSSMPGLNGPCQPK